MSRHSVALTQLMESVQSSSHSFPWCWRIQTRIAKKAPDTETKHQVTTDIIGPLFSAGLLTQESMEDICSGFRADLGQGYSFMSCAVVDVHAHRRNFALSLTLPGGDAAQELTPRTQAKAIRSRQIRGQVLHILLRRRLG